MTLWAAREGSSDQVTVQGTSGAITVRVSEDYRHLRSFHGQLGTLLDGIEQEKAANVADG